ncbi:MAG: DUF2169 domain-containing protein [Desulfobacteraceae bacterium]|nr:MAG: DUF2169 domain-containing protein [Desulfobacteraceae bacterium]
MHLIDNQTPFAAERTLIADKNGSMCWIVAVKATFEIKADGSTSLAPEQRAVSMVPIFSGKDPLVSSLLHENVLEYAKPTTDVYLLGHAYAPRQKPIDSLDVSMKVGPIQKTLRLFGDRHWKNNGKEPVISAPELFVKMPIIYERAFGGVDQKNEDPAKHDAEGRNPIGVGFATQAEHIIDQQLPNIEDPNALIHSWQDRPQPAGFGPIPRHWLPRQELCGTYDENWRKDRFPLLPQDFNERFFQCAPQDQQTREYLTGGEPVELLNLTPTGSLRFNLPLVKLGFRTKIREQWFEHRAQLHTVCLEPDLPAVIMTWHTALPCHRDRLRIEKTEITEKGE